VGPAAPPPAGADQRGEHTAVDRRAGRVAQSVADRDPQAHPALPGRLHLDSQVLPEQVRLRSIANGGQEVVSHDVALA
jgi:hypothetical protein